MFMWLIQDIYHSMFVTLLIFLYNSIACYDLNIQAVDYFDPKPKATTINLSTRQLQIIQVIVEGYSYKMIAEKYFISIDIVRDYTKKYKLLEINSRAELISKSYKNDLF